MIHYSHDTVSYDYILDIFYILIIILKQYNFNLLISEEEKSYRSKIIDIHTHNTIENMNWSLSMHHIYLRSIIENSDYML